MFNKIIENLEFEDINWLISNQIEENQNLEYKRELWGDTVGGKKERLRDIVSMANGYGGYIIIGIEEDGSGRASSIMNVQDAEEKKVSILSSLFANTQPRLQSVKIRILTNDEISVSVMVINVPNSFKKPHMITFEGANKFWIRHDSQKMLMSIEEIKSAVVATINITNEIDSFFAKRKLEAMAHTGMHPTLVIGASPAAVEQEMVDVSDARLRELLKESPEIRRAGANFRFTEEPHPSYSGLYVGNEHSRKIELHRNGYLEGKLNLTDMMERQGEASDDIEMPIVMNWVIMETVYSFTRQIKQIYSYLGYDGPVYIFCSLYNVANLGLREYAYDVHGITNRSLERWSQENLEIDTLVFTEINEINIAKTIGDRIWQSFGFENEPYFKDNIFTL